MNKRIRDNQQKRIVSRRRTQSGIPMTESQIRQQVRGYLRLKGWFVFHNLAGLGVYPGISDLTAIKNGQVWWIELKTAKGQQSEAQKGFQGDVQNADGNYLLVRSIDDLITAGF